LVPHARKQNELQLELDFDPIRLPSSGVNKVQNKSIKYWMEIEQTVGNKINQE